MRRVHRIAPILAWAALACSCRCDPSPPARPAAEAPSPAPVAAPAESPSERAARVHRDAIVFDAHCDTLMRATDDGADLAARSDEGHIDLPRLAVGGVDAQVFAAWVDPSYWPDRAEERALAMIETFERAAAANPGSLELARTAADARRIAAGGRIAGFLGIEGGHAIEDDPEALERFFDRGVRYMTLTWWNNTNWADGSGDEPRWHGLNDLGREVVRTMNRIGMVVDVSHVSDETFWDVLEVTEDPVIASHSNARALADHHRNLSDDMLRALAKNGGVIGINFVAGFLDAEFEKRSRALRKSLEPRFAEIEARHRDDPRRGRKERWRLFAREAAALPKVPLERVIDHIDHAAKVAGVDHVGLGSDFDGFSVGPEGIEDCTDMPRITERLLARGYSEGDVAKILGGNFLRVFEEVIDK